MGSKPVFTVCLNNVRQVIYLFCIDSFINQIGIMGDPARVVPALSISRDVSAGPQQAGNLQLRVPPPLSLCSSWQIMAPWTGLVCRGAQAPIRLSSPQALPLWAGSASHTGFSLSESNRPCFFTPRMS